MEIKNSYESTLIEMKSRFISFLYPVNCVDDFKALLKNLEKEHSKAKHIVYAYKIGDRTKSCDDQEPRGTAGRPLLELINKKKLNNCVIFVVRYFGGVKLGAGKLLRTYLQAGINVVTKLEENENV